MASSALVAFGIFIAVAAGATVRAEDDYGEPEIRDPFEKFNRGIFWFNEFTDRYFLEYFAQAYDFILPDALQRGIRNVFDTAPPFVDGTEVLSINNVPIGYGYDLRGRTFFVNLIWRP